MSRIPPDFDLHSYRYDLPEERIAQQPPAVRGTSKLLVLDRASGLNSLHAFPDLPDLLPPGALLVANNSRVLPARLFGAKPSGGRVEFLLLTPLPLISPSPAPDGSLSAEVDCLLKATKGPRPGETALFDPDLSLTVLSRGEFGRSKARLTWRGDLSSLFSRLGHMPLPPYIHRPDTPEDAARYQTTYADPSKAGSVAAPTAGLHFTPGLRSTLLGRGFSWVEVTLYVGYGTFSPVRCRDIRAHAMHEEWIEVPSSTAAAIQEARSSHRPVVAIGTTSARALEGMFAALGHVGPYTGPTDLYLYPGRPFRVLDALLTNFHLPESSLLIMVSTLAGRERILEAYDFALKSGFHFFSYGDAMLIR